MSFLDHLEQLRWHILRSIVGILLIAIIVFVSKNYVFQTVILGPTTKEFPTFRFFCYLVNIFCDGPGDIQVFTKDLGEQFLIHMKVSFWIGLIVSFPYVFWEFWRFVKPGLYEKEQKVTQGVVFICSFLFLTGVMFGYFVVAPAAISFLAGYSVSELVSNTFTLSSLVNYLTMFTIPTGLVFEMPIVIYFLTKLGVVTPEFLKTYRKHALVLVLVMAAIITPPDVITQFLIGIPLYILYEISIYVSIYVEKKKKE